MNNVEMISIYWAPGDRGRAIAFRNGVQIDSAAGGDAVETLKQRYDNADISPREMLRHEWEQQSPDPSIV